MSDTTTLIRKALDCGVALRLVDGKIKMVGKVEVIREWAPRLRPHRAKLIEALAPPEPAIDWKPLATTYHLHHFNCPACIGAGQGRGLRCGTGTALWVAYQTSAIQTTESKEIL